jgi:ribosomal protein S17E
MEARRLMDEFQTDTKIIPFLVEKITKGVRKQLCGYTKKIKEEIKWSELFVKTHVDEFKQLLDKSWNLKKDWRAIEMMIQENEHNKKIVYEMQLLNQQIRDEFMDLKLLNIEMQQKLKIREVME